MQPTVGIAYDTGMKWRVVLDTNVVVSAMRSRRGASFAVLELVESGRIEICLSPPLVLEYEAALAKQLRHTNLTRRKLETLLNALCSIAHLQEIFFLWRPHLRDPLDELVLETAVAGRCRAIITHNVRHFEGTEKFGIRVMPPGELLGRIGA